MAQRKCDMCGRGHWGETNQCHDCWVESRKAPKAQPIGDVTVTGGDFKGNKFNPVEVEYGVDEVGRGWVRSRQVGTFNQKVEHSDQLGDGLRTHFTEHTFPWSEWTERS